jgi:predicted nucleic acid-binding protein
MILVDANILLRLGNKSDPEYRRAQRVVFRCRQSEPLVIVPQSLFEFWAVATRALDVNGLGMDTPRARVWILNFLRMFPLLSEPSELVGTWADLVARYDVKGFRAHDARYVAMMQLHGIQRLLTYNVKHFDPFPISILDPRDSVTFP